MRMVIARRTVVQGTESSRTFRGFCVRRWLLVVDCFLCLFWLGFLLFGLAAIGVWGTGAKPGLAFRVVAVIWLVGWLLFGLFGLIRLLNLYCLRTTISLSPSKLGIENRMWCRVTTKEFPWAEVDGFFVVRHQLGQVADLYMHTKRGTIVVERALATREADQISDELNSLSAPHEQR